MTAITRCHGKSKQPLIHTAVVTKARTVFWPTHARKSAVAVQELKLQEVGCSAETFVHRHPMAGPHWDMRKVAVVQGILRAGAYYTTPLCSGRDNVTCSAPPPKNCHSKETSCSSGRMAGTKLLHGCRQLTSLAMVPSQAAVAPVRPRRNACDWVHSGASDIRHYSITCPDCRVATVADKGCKAAHA